MDKERMRVWAGKMPVCDGCRHRQGDVCAIPHPTSGADPFKWLFIYTQAERRFMMAHGLPSVPMGAQLSDGRTIPLQDFSYPGPVAACTGRAPNEPYAKSGPVADRMHRLYDALDRAGGSVTTLGLVGLFNCFGCGSVPLIPAMYAGGVWIGKEHVCVCCRCYERWAAQLDRRRAGGG